MSKQLKARDVSVGFHPEGYRIDKTAEPMNRYTKWDVVSADNWHNPRPVCFDSMPQEGWLVAEKFDWDKIDFSQEKS